MCVWECDFSKATVHTHNYQKFQDYEMKTRRRERKKAGPQIEREREKVVKMIFL